GRGGWRRERDEPDRERQSPKNWRERVGIEPTSDALNARPRDLKSPESTRTHAFPHFKNVARHFSTVSNSTATSLRATATPTSACHTRRRLSAPISPPAFRGEIAMSKPPEVCGS